MDNEANFDLSFESNYSVGSTVDPDYFPSSQG
jgi:hypothetical protein